MPRLALVLLLMLSSTVLTVPASAECKRLGFAVNDYGKEGPTRDAKRLLDDYIKRWAAEQGISQYRVGKKTVTCELFLGLIFFDGHTCKASATFCWSKQAGKR